MTQQPTPQLKRLAHRSYQCGDIAAFHRWLETNGYQFYGQHNPGEYGRFSHHETLGQGDQRIFSNGYIVVMTNGEVYTPEPFAWELLDTLVNEDDLGERTA